MSSPEPAQPPISSAWTRVADHIAAVARTLAANPVVVIDGASGTGKSTLADEVVSRWPGAEAQLVRMDDIYPGWEGLSAASHHVHDELLAPLAARGAARWQRWDWAAQAPAEWHEVAGGHPLIIEGCGCLTRATAPLVTLRVWLVADSEVRKRRALERDRGGFDAFWDLWQSQWAALVAAEHPDALADLVLDTTRSPVDFSAERPQHGTVGE